MGAVSFSIYFTYIKYGYLLSYMQFFKVYLPYATTYMPSARESINISSSRDRAKFANTVLRSMFSLGFLFGPFIGAQLIELKGYSGLFAVQLPLYYLRSFYKSFSIRIYQLNNKFLSTTC